MTTKENTMNFLCERFALAQTLPKYETKDVSKTNSLLEFKLENNDTKVVDVESENSENNLKKEFCDEGNIVIMSKNIKKRKIPTEQNNNLKNLKKKFLKCKKKKNYKSAQKYPGISFLKSKLRLKSSKKGIISLKEFEKLKLESIEEYKKMKRRAKRQTRRDKEKLFRHNLEKAFDVENVEIVKKEELQVQIEEDLFKNKSKFSTFPLKFKSWVQKEDFYWSKTLDFDVSTNSDISSMDNCGEELKSLCVFRKLRKVLERSKGVNSRGAKEVAEAYDNLKELTYINK